MANDRDDQNYVPPRPWSVCPADGFDAELGRCYGIVDANGREVVCTDSGFYPPNKATADLIVTLVNNYYAGDKS